MFRYARRRGVEKAIRDFIREELQRQKAICDSLPEDRNKDWTALNRCFAEMIDFTV